MSSFTKSDIAAIPKWKWAVVVMMLFATTINYMDRQTLGSISSFIKADFHLGEEGYGKLESVFGYSYAVFLLAAGFMADRVNLRWLYPLALLVWSAAGFATGFVETLFQLQVCRAILGGGEAFNWPVAVGIVGRIIPRESRALANSIFNSGMTVGAILTPLLVLALVSKTGEGWRQMFMIVGALGAVWVVIWLYVTRGSRANEMSLPPARTADSAAATPFLSVFTMRRFWIVFGLCMAVNMSWHFYRVWLPRHLVTDLKFTDQQLQLLLIAFYLTADVGSIGIGYLARKLVTPTCSVDRARKKILLLASGLCLMATPLLLMPGRDIMFPLYCIVGAGLMGVFAILYAFLQDVSPQHTSKCLGIMGSSVWFVNSFLHPIVGKYADTHVNPMGKFAPMILVAGVLPLLATLFALTWPETKETDPVPDAT